MNIAKKVFKIVRELANGGNASINPIAPKQPPSRAGAENIPRAAERPIDSKSAAASTAIKI
jgi:hypothetical protein